MKKIFNDLKLKIDSPNWALDPELALIDTALGQHPQRHLHSNQLFVSTGSMSLKAEVFMDAIDSFAVNRDASPVYGNMNAPVAVKSVF